jgi:hypothetical protein
MSTSTASTGAKAIELVAQWAAALERLHARVSEFVAECGWDGLASIAEIQAASARAIRLPDPAPDVEDVILALANETIPRQSLSTWADLAGRAKELDARVEAMCQRGEIERDPNSALLLVERAKALGIADAPVETLSQVCDEASASAEAIVRIVRLLADLLSTVRRDLASGMDVKAEAMAAGFLHVMGQLSPENVRYRSAALSEDGAIEHLTAAQAVANEANAAAVEAKFDETPSIALAQSIPSVQELRQAAGIFRTTGLVSRLFGSEWRRAKAVWRQTFPTERRTSPVDTARRLMSAALWKERLARLEANSGAKAAAGRYWLDAATAFEPLLQVAAWMKLVRSQTPLAESGARELRRLAFEGGPDAIVMLSDLAHTAEELDLLGVFRKCYAQKSSIAVEAQRQVERASALRKAWATAGQFGLRPGNAITALADAVAALRNVSECRKAWPMSRLRQTQPRP